MALAGLDEETSALYIPSGLEVDVTVRIERVAITGRLSLNQIKDKAKRTNSTSMVKSIVHSIKYK